MCLISGYQANYCSRFRDIGFFYYLEKGEEDKESYVDLKIG